MTFLMTAVQLYLEALVLSTFASHKSFRSFRDVAVNQSTVNLVWKPVNGVCTPVSQHNTQQRCKRVQPAYDDTGATATAVDA
jgi:hypothetical protein